MKNFFRDLLTSCLGSTIAIVVGGLIIMFIFIGVLGSMGDGSARVVEIEGPTVLKISFDVPIVERGNDKAPPLDLGLLGDVVGMGLNDIIEDIDKARQDENIKGIFLDMPSIAGSPSTLSDVRQALLKFKESGKWIIAFAETIGQGSYYVSSVADEFYLYPEGDLSFYGLSAELTYFKGLLDKLDIDIQVLRGPNNKYKSAVEPFLKEHITEPNREQMEALLDDIWRVMLEGISESRGIPVAKLQALADNLSIGLPQDALSSGLVDGLKYRDEVIEIIKEKMGTNGLVSDDDEDNKNDVESIELDDYHHVFVSGLEKTGNRKSDRVAVVYAVGGIESGQGDDQTIGSERIAGALREARQDDRVKAVVLRVNSPGGSALASDVIWRETELIKDAGKPLVVSMGDVAASGGYYISCSANKIFANANTITGSIGVFGMIPNLQGFYNNKLGVTFDRVNTGEHADMWSTSKALDVQQDSIINRSITAIYEQFIGLVASGRGLTVAEVDSVARGRVWSGVDAMEIGLVDEIGNLEDAINEAVEMAGLEEYRIKELPRMEDPFEKILKDLTDQASTRVVEQKLGDAGLVFKQLMEFEKIMQYQGVQARMPFFLEIK